MVRGRAVLALGLFAALCGAGESVQPQLDAILDELKRKTAAARPATLDEETWPKWRETYDALRAEAAAKVEELARRHGPGGEETALDVRPACEALLGAALVPRGREAWAVALRVLKLDPRSADCWGYLELLRERILEEHAGKEPPWRDLADWTRVAREQVDGEAALALDTLRARCALDLGDRKAARELARAVLVLEPSRDLRRAAAQVCSLSSLLPLGKEAPAFRIASLDGKSEHVLEEWRGRCVLLYFQHLIWHDLELLKVVEGVVDRHPSTELLVLTIPLGDDPDAIALLRAHPETAEWPTAAPGETADDVGRAYGVEGVSALYLLGPDGRVLANGDWDAGASPERVDALVREAVGPPIAESLQAVAGTPSWHLVRETWHGLLARNRTEFEPATWTAAAKLGRRAVDVLLLAAAEGRASRPPVALPPATDLHSRVAEARHARRRGEAAPWDALLPALSNPRSDDCRALVDALLDLGVPDADLRAPLEKVAQRAEWEAASTALRCLRWQECDDPPRAIRRLEKEKTWQVRLALAEALRAYRHKESVDALLGLLGDRRLRVRDAAVRSLEELTGESLGTSQKRWAEWRRAQGADLRFAPRVISRYTPLKRDAHKYAHRDYYGLQVASNEVVFVLDKSDSMYYGLFDGVVEEMEAHLASAGPTTKFNVVEFDAEPRAWQKKLVPANAANLRDAVAWLRRSTPYGPTNVIDSLREGLRTPDVDSVVLLSDGLPNRGEPARPGGILEAVQRENRYARVAIHTVLLLEGRRFPHDAPRGKDAPPLDDGEKARREAWRAGAAKTELGSFLKELAEGNDGTFGVGFADAWMPPPGASTRPSSDE